MTIVNKFNVNKEQVTLDADIIENMSANDVSYDASTQYDENTVGDKLSKLSQQVIYDVTVNNDGVTFASLSELLLSENLSTFIPTSVRHGGMSVRFIQSSDNKYVQYFLTKNVWSDNEADWQKLNLEEEVSQEAKKNYINLIQSEQIGIITSKTEITDPVAGYYNESGVFVSDNSFRNQKITINHSKTYYVEMVINSNYNISTIVLFDTNDNVIGIQKYTETHNNKYFLKFPNSVAKFAISNTPNNFHIYEITVSEIADGIPDGAVTTTKIADGAVTTTKIAYGAVTTDKRALIPNMKAAEWNDYFLEVYIDKDTLAAESIVFDKITVQYNKYPIVWLWYQNNVVLRLQKNPAIKGYNILTSPSGSQSNVRAYVLLGDTPTLYSDSSYNVDMKRIFDPAQNPHVYQFYNKIKSDQITDSAVTTTKIADGAVTLSKLANGSINSDKILDDSVSSAKILNGSITDKKTDFFKLGINLLNPSEVHDKAYYAGSYLSNNDYCASGYIAIEPETTYYWKNFSNKNNHTSARFVCWCAEDKSTVLLETNVVASGTSPSGAKYVVITYSRYSTQDQPDNLYFGKENPVNLIEFPVYRLKIPAGLIDFSDESFQINTDEIADGAITKEKIASGVHVDAYPSRFGVLTSGVQTVAANGTIYTPSIFGFKNISIVAHIDSTFNEIVLGGGKDSFYQVAFKIDGTNVQMLTGSSATVRWTDAHGLTFGSHTLIYITTYYSGADKITIYNDEGEFWSHSINYGNGGGIPYLTNNGNSVIDAEIRFEMRDINQKIWLFGDSYFSYDSDARWTYYMNADGFNENLISSLGGLGSSGAIQSFTNLLSTGARPSFAVWCMGMNDGSDSGNTPVAEWLNNIQNFLTLCENYGITPILATVPTVPNINHVGKTSWVKNSGYRYIDFAKAVEVYGATTWKNWGMEKAMLSSDEVHPTAYGAKALYQQVIRDFPDIMVTC